MARDRKERPFAAWLAGLAAAAAFAVPGGFCPDEDRTTTKAGQRTAVVERAETREQA